ncbi:MAG: YopX family protein [Bacilli bacterium]
MRTIDVRAWDVVNNDWFDMVESEEICNVNFGAKQGTLIVELSIGLRDKNDQSIYEGDIVFQYTGNNSDPKAGKGNYKNGIVDVVRESISGGCWEPCGHGRVDGKTRPLWEVIGNMHENPELLK